MMQAHKIEITIDEKGNFTYCPTFLRVLPGDEITFKYLSGDHFEVVFKEKSPGDRLYLWEGDPKMKIREDAEYAIYHYAAAGFTCNRVFLDSACGDIGVGGN
jgi:plastocyanin